MDRKGINLSAGNWITIIVIVFGAVSMWVKMQIHIDDDNLHLTDQQRKNLVQFTTIVDEKLPLIDENSAKIIIIDKDFAVLITEFNNLESEHNDLEDKLSRIYKELKDELSE